MNLTVHKSDTWWNMLIKFNKEIGNNFAKINKIKIIKDPIKQLRWSFIRKLLLASEANSESCHISKIKLFARNSQKQKVVHDFCKRDPFWMFDDFLNMFLNWLPKLRMFHV